MRTAFYLFFLAAPFVGVTSGRAAEPVAKASAAAAARLDPARLAAADRLMEITHVEQVMRGVMPKIIEMMLPIFLKGNTGHEQEVSNIVADAFGRKFTLLIPAMRQKTRDLYAEKFEIGELDTLTAFYSSPLGHKMIELAPQIQLEMMKFGQQAGAAAAQAAMPEILERLKSANLAVPTSS